MNEPWEVIEYRGCTIEVWQDEDPESPREWDNLGTMCCEHRRYNLGDGGMELLHEALMADPRWSEFEEPPLGPGEFTAMVKLARKWDFTFLPLYLYDHSGITMSTSPFSCPWDSGQVGVIFCSPQKQHEEKMTKEQVEKCLKGEVETYDEFLTGRVYGIIVKDRHGDEIDSCWGYYGQEYAIEEGRSWVDHHLKEVGDQLELDIAL